MPACVARTSLSRELLLGCLEPRLRELALLGQVVPLLGKALLDLPPDPAQLLDLLSEGIHVLLHTVLVVHLFVDRFRVAAQGSRPDDGLDLADRIIQSSGIRNVGFTFFEIGAIRCSHSGSQNVLQLEELVLTTVTLLDKLVHLFLHILLLLLRHYLRSRRCNFSFCV